MENRKKQRCIYVTARQKKKLIELMTKHPELVTCKLTQDFNYKDSQKLWQDIANECHSIPGARKTWKQWRKTWHDLRSKMKKKQAEINGELPKSITDLNPAEQEVLGIKASNERYQETIEFIMLDDNQQENINEDLSVTLSDPESPKESKVFMPDQKKRKVKMKNGTKSSSNHNSSCYFNCDVLAVQEQRKIQIKEDYLNFKKDYLRQKLKLIKEQTEALKSIAKELYMIRQLLFDDNSEEENCSKCEKEDYLEADPAYETVKSPRWLSFTIKLMVETLWTKSILSLHAAVKLVVGLYVFFREY